jgi:hypothetical protein
MWQNFDDAVFATGSRPDTRQQPSGPERDPIVPKDDTRRTQLALFMNARVCLNRLSSLSVVGLRQEQRAAAAFPIAPAAPTQLSQS